MHVLRSLVLIAAAVAQIVCALAPGLFGIDGSIGDTAERARTALVPAGYAFSIWALLYAGGIYVAGWHLLRPRSNLAATVGLFAALAFTGDAVWALHQPAFGPGLVSFLLLQPILVFAYLAGWRSAQSPAPGPADRVAGAILWALSGWITVASAAGLSLALKLGGLWPLVGDEAQSASVLLLLWAPLALILAFRARAIAFAAPIAWGLHAIAVRNPETGALPLVIAAVVIGAALAGKLRDRNRAVAVYSRTALR